MLNQIEVTPRHQQSATLYSERNYASPHLVTSEARHWLFEYEKQESNIFKYYSIDNEVTFIRNTKDLPPDQQQFYLQENVKRFLAEFVGKVPYTTIPYSISEGGFDYAGMKVMDSYQKAADLGGEREKAETFGFKEIENEMKSSIKSDEKALSAFWISPPKNWDYGFVFALIPDTQNHVREYILRYDEPRTTLGMSNYLMHMLGDTTYQNTDDFLRHPLFMKKNGADETLTIIMRTIGIDENTISQSRQFEHHIDTILGPGIALYTDAIMQAVQSKEDPELITQAKLLLIQLYRQAEQIKAEIESYSPSVIQTLTPVSAYNATQVDYSGIVANISYLDKGPLVSGGGSCPSLQDTEINPFDQSVHIFTSSFDHLQKLQNGPLESFFKKTEISFPCPLCGTLIPSGQGITQCPNKPACGITKEKYAQMVNGKQCD
jgi:hypothetical protein